MSKLSHSIDYLLIIHFKTDNQAKKVKNKKVDTSSQYIIELSWLLFEIANFKTISYKTIGIGQKESKPLEEFEIVTSLSKLLEKVNFENF